LFDLKIAGGNVYVDGKFQMQDVAITDGKIREIGNGLGPATKTIELGGEKVYPGFIDTQVHFREPGLTHKEDLETGSRAAALGGVTTFFEMPNTTPPTTTAESIAEKVAIAKKKSFVNFAFFMGATGQNIDELKKVQDLEGCCGIKIFLGSSTGSLLLYGEEELLEVFRQTKAMISCHSENEDMLRERKPMLESATTAHTHPEWRNAQTAFSSTTRLVGLARKAGRKVHVLHISTKEEMEFLSKNKDACTVEVLPQHLTLFAPDCYDRLDTYAQMNPPIRTIDHQERLWQGVLDGTVDLLGSDHAPHLKSEKDKGYPNSPAGMPGVQTIVPLMLNYVAEGKLPEERLIELMCTNPRKLFNLNKGAIEVGLDADFTVVKENTPWTIENKDQASRCGWTPFDGTKVASKPTMTIVGGVVVMENGEVKERAGKPAL
jgi:dihydroorotase